MCLSLLLWMFPIANAYEPGQIIGELRHTRYWVAHETDSRYANLPRTENLRDQRGRSLARVSERFKRDADLEGTAKLLDGRVLNYVARIDGEVRYRVTPNEWGDAFYHGCPLRPFHTIAVDPDVVPLGSVVRIEETVNLRLPDGTLHDGLWRADDTGGAILRDRVDLFIGDRMNQRILDRAGLGNMSALTIRMVHTPGSTDCLTD